MKNNFLKYLISFLILFLNNQAISDDLVFKTKTINIIDNGKKTIAEDGIAYFEKENLEIEGSRFEYDDEKKFLEVTNSNSILEKENIKIKSDKMTYNRNTLELIAQDNVVLINLNDNSKIFTNELIYNNKTKKIISNVNSEFKDEFDNSIYTGNFIYDLQTHIAKIDSLKLVDTKKNE